MKCSVLAVAVLAALLLAAGCSSAPPSTATATPAHTIAASTYTTSAPNLATMAVYTLNDNGRTVSLGLGESLAVSLPEDLSSGSAWGTSITDGLKITNNVFIPDDPANATSHKGTRTLAFQAVKVGT